MELFGFLKLKKQCQQCKGKFAEIFHYYPIDSNNAPAQNTASISTVLLCKNCLDQKHDEDLLKFGKKVKSTFTHNKPSSEQAPTQQKPIEFE